MTECTPTDLVFRKASILSGFAQCRVKEGHCCPPLPSEPCVRVVPAHGSGKPLTSRCQSLISVTSSFDRCGSAGDNTSVPVPDCWNRPHHLPSLAPCDGGAVPLH